MRHAIRYHASREYRTEPSEDSDLTVALFRLAVIIAFTASTRFGPSYTAGLPALVVVLVAATYTLLLMGGYLAARRWVTRQRKQVWASRPVLGPLLRRRLAIQRATAIVVDLVLVTAIIDELGSFARPYMGVYYVIVAVAAVWFHRDGGVLAALGAAGCVAWVTLRLSRLYPDDPSYAFFLRSEAITQSIILMAVGLVTGYLARARDAERARRERIDAELELASTVQQQMLPERLPALPGYELAVCFAPARVVGGDYYDAIEGHDGALYIVVADVAGRSVYAVLHLSLLRSRLHEAVREGLAPAAVGDRLNRALVDALPEGSFISLFCGALDPESGTLRFVNCGHTPPVLIREGEAEGTELLFTGDMVLGVLEESAYREGVVTLQPGDCMVCCSDGVTETLNAEWQAYGTEGVALTAKAETRTSADRLAERVVQAAREHGGRRSGDDETVLVLFREPPS